MISPHTSETAMMTANTALIKRCSISYSYFKSGNGHGAAPDSP